MSAGPLLEVVGTAVFADAYDGVIRLLGDAQRFGFELRGLEVVPTPDEGASAKFILKIPISADPQLTAARLARHPCFQSLDIQVKAGSEACLLAAAA